MKNVKLKQYKIFSREQARTNANNSNEMPAKFTSHFSHFTTIDRKMLGMLGKC